MKLAVLEPDYHAEVLRNLCEALQLCTAIQVSVFSTTSIARAAGLDHLDRIRTYCSEPGESFPAFIERHRATLDTCDVLFFNTLASHFRYFAGLKTRPVRVLRLHNAAAYLQPGAPWRPIFTPFFLWKDASHWVRKVLFEREPYWRRAFMQTVDYCCFPDASLEAFARRQGWLREVSTLDPLPFTLHLPGFDRIPENSERHITVIGSIDPRRRDYGSVVEAFRQVLPRLQNRCVLTFLGRPRGRYGSQLLQEAQSLQGSGFTLRSYSAFVPQQEFERVIRETDFLLIPALDKTRYTIYTEYYGKTKISGNVYDMIRYGKPALLPEHYGLDADVEMMAGRYSGVTGLAKQLQNWIDGDGLSTSRKAIPEALKRYEPEAVRATMERILLRLPAKNAGQGE